MAIDGRDKPGAVEIEQARGRWLSVEPVLARELVDALTGADLESGEAEAIGLAVQLSLATVFRTTNAEFSRHAHKV